MDKGKKEWFIPDCYLSSVSNGKFISHEAICVLNLHELDAEIELVLYYEDKEPLYGFKVQCKSKRTNHIRLDKIKSNTNQTIPFDTCYAIHVVSSVPIVVQYSRMDSGDSALALMSTIAY